MTIRPLLRTALVSTLLVGLAAQSAAAACVSPPSGLVGWWRGQNNAKDAIAGNNGNLQTTTFATGKVGQGFSFAPSGVVIPNQANYDVQSPGFTAEFWMKGAHDQPEALSTVLEKSHISASGWAFQVPNATGILRFTIGNGSSFPEISTLSDVLDGTFHHIAGTWNGTTMRLYVDGVLQSSTGITTPAASAGGINIGTWLNSSRGYKGVVDEVSVYGRELSLAEIQGIVTAGTDGKCTTCGNNVVDPDEDCDDGGLTSGDCCSGSCQFEAVDSPCGDDGNVCTDEGCDGAGTCLHPDNTASCDDLQFCNGTDTCAGGSCGHSGDPCTSFGECADVCNDTTDTCDPETMGTSCTSDGNACTNDVCNGTGACGVPNSAPCDDGNACTIGDTCSLGVCVPGGSEPVCDDSNPCTADSCDSGTGCVYAETPRDISYCLIAPMTKLQISDSSDPAKDKLSWQWGKGEEFDQMAVGDPTAATTYALCIYDTAAMVPSLAASLEIPASLTLWKNKTPKGVNYSDKNRAADGAKILQLKTGLAGKTKVKLLASGASLPLPGPASSLYFAQTPRVVVQLINSAGTCWTSQFTTGDTTKNEATMFKAATK